MTGFMPSTQTLEREAQELAAIIECTDVEFLPPSKREKLDKFGGREKLQERLTAIKQILEERKSNMARHSWIDAEANPDLDAHVEQLEHFTKSIADGVIDAESSRRRRTTSSPR